MSPESSLGSEDWDLVKAEVCNDDHRSSKTTSLVFSVYKLREKRRKGSVFYDFKDWIKICLKGFFAKVTSGNFKIISQSW